MITVKLETNFEVVKEVFLSEYERVQLESTPTKETITLGKPREGVLYLSAWSHNRLLGIVTLEPFSNTLVPEVFEAHILLKQENKGLGKEIVRQGLTFIKKEIPQIQEVILNIPTFFKAAREAALQNGFKRIAKLNQTVKKNRIEYKVERFIKDV